MSTSFKSIDNPLETLVNESGKNIADILCPKENCKCVILRKNTATLVEREGAKVWINNPIFTCCNNNFFIISLLCPLQHYLKIPCYKIRIVTFGMLATWWISKMSGSPQPLVPPNIYPVQIVILGPLATMIPLIQKNSLSVSREQNTFFNNKHQMRTRCQKQTNDRLFFKWGLWGAHNNVS